MATAGEVRRQYERWPYPCVPVLASVRRFDTWQLNAAFLWDRAGMGIAPDRPRVWIAGCGTLQPYVFRLANPRASILATDLSARSLRIAERRCQWHGAYGVEFAHVDLTDEAQLPDGPFDVIECYGVLMNLADPLAALRALTARLSERGVLRVMVYPHYGRRRIFQLQRVAKLCGLRFEERTHPGLLRAIVATLPPAHPLRYAFDSYGDARNDEGLVDGFLHAGDRGFTGIEFGELCEQAGLRPAFWFHRPWARPDAMAERLGLGHTSQAFVLHYLDLWQELRGNYVCCLVRDGGGTVSETPIRPHPLLALGSGTSVADTLLRLSHRVTGVRLPSRTDDGAHQVAAREVRALRRLAASPDRDPETVERLRRAGVLLGGVPERAAMGATGGSFSGVLPLNLEVGNQVVNPFYSHLFEAWATGPTETGEALPQLERQLEQWGHEADPLEDAERPFGLTPFGTYQEKRRVVDAWRCRSTSPEAVESWTDWPLRERERERVRALLDRAGVPGARSFDRARSNELWSLLCSWEQLLLSGDSFD